VARFDYGRVTRAPQRQRNRQSLLSFKQKLGSNLPSQGRLILRLLETTMRAALLASVIAAVGFVSVGLATLPVEAGETGMASMHTWVKVGRKTCLADHEHSGSGTGSNKKLAELQAIRSWAGFTDLEYGSSWANFSLAVGKSIKCEPAGGGFQCDLLARACRPF
jgi:hypothetical protein